MAHIAEEIVDFRHSRAASVAIMLKEKLEGRDHNFTSLEIPPPPANRVPTELSLNIGAVSSALTNFRYSSVYLLQTALNCAVQLSEGLDFQAVAIMGHAFLYLLELVQEKFAF